jgi:hypothetical protein
LLEHKIYIHRIQNQFNGHEHGDQVATREKPVNANKEHQRAYYQEMGYRYSGDHILRFKITDYRFKNL